MKTIIKYGLLAIIIAIIIFFLFLFIYTTISRSMSRIPSSQDGIILLTGCFDRPIPRYISIFLFPVKDPVQCIFRGEDALTSFPYHLILASVISFFLYKRLKKINS